MKTVTIMIGNSDGHLSQSGWHDFYTQADSVIQSFSTAVHFSGAPPNYAKWQNAAWVVEISVFNETVLRNLLVVLCGRFEQNSIAWVEGNPKFIFPTGDNQDNLSPSSVQ